MEVFLRQRTLSRHAYLLATSVAIKIDRSLLLNLFRAPRRFACKATRKVFFFTWNCILMWRFCFFWNLPDISQTFFFLWNKTVPVPFDHEVGSPSFRGSAASGPLAVCSHTYCRRPWMTFRPIRSKWKPDTCPVKTQISIWANQTELSLSLSTGFPHKVTDKIPWSFQEWEWKWFFQVFPGRVGTRSVHQDDC